MADPIRPCPTCGHLTPGGHCPQHPRNRGGYRPTRPSLPTYRSRQYRRLRLATLTAAGWQCAYCTTRADTADHVIPHSHGGPTQAANLVAACRPCNTAKGDRTLQQWLATGTAPTPAHLLAQRRHADGLPT